MDVGVVEQAEKAERQLESMLDRQVRNQRASEGYDPRAWENEMDARERRRAAQTRDRNRLLWASYYGELSRRHQASADRAMAMRVQLLNDAGVDTGVVHDLDGDEGEAA